MEVSPSDGQKKTYTDLIVLGAVAIYFAILGVGFIALRSVNNAIRRMPEDIEPKPLQRLMTARLLARIAVLLFFMNWLGLFMMAAGHGNRARRLKEEQRIERMQAEAQKQKIDSASNRADTATRESQRNR